MLQRREEIVPQVSSKDYYRENGVNLGNMQSAGNLRTIPPTLSIPKMNLRIGRKSCCDRERVFSAFRSWRKREKGCFPACCRSSAFSIIRNCQQFLKINGKTLLFQLQDFQFVESCKLTSLHFQLSRAGEDSIRRKRENFKTFSPLPRKYRGVVSKIPRLAESCHPQLIFAAITHDCSSMLKISCHKCDVKTLFSPFTSF